MRITFVRVGIACAAFLALVFLVVTIAPLAADEPTVLEACINPGNGGMRLVDAGEACHKKETRVEWNVQGPQGPPGPQGPQGPPGSSASGPPFVWICTPANFPNGGGGPRSDLYVFNGSPSTANVAVNILDKNGVNLSGVTIPGSSPSSTYPGQTGSSTVMVAPANTLNVNWVMPTTGGPGFDGVTDVAFTVRVVSDQPIAVGSNFQFGGFMPNQCSLLPK